MKAITTIATIVFLCFISSINVNSQEIEINLTFTRDTVIFPFGNIDTISELTMEGGLALHSDTSLVRVILEDDSGIQFMILEAYPLICPDLDFSFTHHCDETCFLDLVNPYSIIIQIIDASIDLSSLYYSSDTKENSIEERYKVKRTMDAVKIETMNKQINFYGMNWVAGDNEIVALYSEQKRIMFGEGYNLIGYDYYHDGVFEFLGHRNYPKVDPGLVRHFDWRDRHGANDPSSPYWDGDTLGTGWLTSVKNQYPYSTCWAFSTAGQTEAIANLYANDTLDFDLSEREIIICIQDTCMAGDPSLALDYLEEHGVVPENCFPYDEMDCAVDTCTDKCTEPDYVIRISNSQLVNEEDFDAVRLALINTGPLSVGYYQSWGINPGNHSVVLSGYIFDNSDSSCIWIIKNSWGLNSSWGKHGFCNLKVNHFLSDKVAKIITPIYRNDTALSINCWDKDEDGYCFWGISSQKPENCNCSGVKDCDDNNPFVGGYDENFYCTCLLEMDTVSHHITSDTTWSDTTYVNFEVIIDSGACLTISSYAAFAPEAGIIVKQGGELNVNGGYLTKVCPDLWKGIEVWGSDTLQSFDKYFGQVNLSNNAIIEFAKVGISNYCTECDSNSLQSGGLVRADNSVFRNNTTDVYFAPFKNMWQGNELPYFSGFEKCTFVTTEEFYPEFIPDVHVELNDIRALAFYGCIFKNETFDSIYPFPIRGTGIFSIDANFMLLKACNTQIVPCNDFTSCEFRNLEYGVKAMNSYSEKTLSICEVKFEENLIGISLSGIDYVSIVSNDFNCLKYIDQEINNRFTGGLFMEGCSGYHIEDNFFHGTLNPIGSISPSYGIGVKNSGPDNNEIYNNEFYRVHTGIYVMGENRGERDPSGLCLKCNDMSNNTNDFIVVEDDSTFTGIQGIRPYQGNPDDTISATAPAGNLFTLFTIPADSTKVEHYNYFNAAENIYYIHHQRVTYPFVTYPLDDNYTEETIERIERDYQYDSIFSCPSTIGGIGLKSYTDNKASIILADENISALTNQLNLLIDGGNTDELNFEVMTSLPDEGLEISQELLSDSPYLSDTVIKQAIYKEEVLPNAMILDIMIANPQSAKKNDLLKALDSRFDPMPDYMMAQIMGGREYFGAKELLEFEIQSWKQIRSKAKNELFRMFLLDTSIINPADSVIAFLENENDLRSKYDLAFAYWNKKDSINAWLTLTDISYQFSLNGDLNAIHLQYSEYFNILQRLVDSNWRACDLDSTSVESLINLIEHGNADISAHARGLLVKGGFMNYLETLHIPLYSKSCSIANYFKEEVSYQPKSEKLKLFPNPAGDFVIVYYDVNSEYLSASIILFDVKGNMLRKYLLKDQENQVVLNLSDLPNGLYLISLQVDRQILDAKKLSKGRY